ncbi:MAG TPA: hypothetical protein VNT20_03095 [Flavisolibacter sp.]|jgi:hypothetical protein|nr:hypothetical protein [Flavisolibacter sp.]
MKKRKKMVIVVAIAVAIACTHHSIKKEKTKPQLPAKEASIPYVPTAFSDMSLFPGNVFQFLINHL